MGRPQKDIDEKTVYELAKIHCTKIEIAKICNCSVDTLDRRFADLIEKAKSEGKSSLRAAQMRLALSGNATMLVWLGKCMLGQVEFTQDEMKQIKEILIRIDPSRMPDATQSA